MYILFIASGYPTKKYMGNGIFEFDQAKAISKIGCKVVYVSIDVRSIRRWRKWGFERNNIEGIVIYSISIPLGRVPQKLLDKISLWGLNFLYRKILSEHGKPNILHAHFTQMGYLAANLKRQIKIPLVITEHSSLIIKEIIKKDIFKKAKIAYACAEKVLAVSPNLAKNIEKNFGIKPLYVPNIVDTNIFSYTIKTNDEKFHFVSIGNLITSKRLDLVIEAFNRSFYLNNNVTLTIFGEGEERYKLESMIQKYNIGKRVILKGMCSRYDIAEYLRNCDCFVLPSQFETFGVAYIEAMAVGVPIIATKCGGPEVFINDQNGILIQIDNIDELISAMEYMFVNSNKYDRYKIAQATKSFFSPDKVGLQIMEVYKEILKI